MWLFLILCVSSASRPHETVAQDEAVVDALARLMAMEDSRRYDGALLASLYRYPDSLVRRQAAVTMGRLGNPDALPMLIELLLDDDSTVVTRAVFGLGLLGDMGALDRLRQMVLDIPLERHWDAQPEAVAGIAGLGGPEAAEFFGDLLERYSSQSTSDDGAPTVRRALVEAWRLGANAPVEQLRRFAESSPDWRIRWAAIYSLARLGSPGAANTLLTATADAEGIIRSQAVAALTSTMADSAGLDRTALASRVARLTDDSDARVRINALRALATYEDTLNVDVAIDRLSDRDPSVRVQAIRTLAAKGGRTAINELFEQVDRGVYQVRFEALRGLNELAAPGAFEKVGEWMNDDSWEYRMGAALSLARASGDTAVAWLEYLAGDPNSRVAAAAVRGLGAVDADYGYFVAVDNLTSIDPVVRRAAVALIGEAGDDRDLEDIVAAYGMRAGGPRPTYKVAVLGAMNRMVERGVVSTEQIESALLLRHPAETNYLARRAAADMFPGLARAWGPTFPVETFRELNDYRDIVRRFVLPAGRDGRRPQVVIDTDRGQLTVELVAGIAPLTVYSLIELIERRFFDDGRWHRVVPNFVIQDGDPRGDGYGGPDYALRDEVSWLRYTRGTVGLALSGPDTGGSQFFIAHSPQPHLEWTYPIIGTVTSGFNVIDNITQGDRIRRVRLN